MKNKCNTLPFVKIIVIETFPYKGQVLNHIIVVKDYKSKQNTARVFVEGS